MKPLILVGNHVKASRQSVPKQLADYVSGQNYMETTQKVESDFLTHPELNKEAIWPSQGVLILNHWKDLRV